VFGGNVQDHLDIALEELFIELTGTFLVAPLIRAVGQGLHVLRVEEFIILAHKSFRLDLDGKDEATWNVESGDLLVPGHDPLYRFVLDESYLKGVRVHIEGLANQLPHGLDLIVTFHDELVPHTLLRSVKRNPEVLSLDDLDLWDGQAKRHVRLIGEGDSIAVRAPHLAFKLPMKHIHDDALISFQMVLPGGSTCLFIIDWGSFFLRAVQLGNKGLHFYSIEIFMETIQ